MTSPDDGPELKEVIKGIGFGWRGTSSFARGVAMPIIDAVANDLRACGLAEALDDPQFPPDESPRTIQPRADAFVVPALVALSIFVGSSIGSWVVGKLCNEMWDVHIGPALKRWRRAKESDGKARFDTPFEFRVGCYFATDDLKVTVTTIVGSEHDLEEMERLLPEAERRALQWVQDKGISSRELVYTIKDGQLSSFPRVN